MFLPRLLRCSVLALHMLSLLTFLSSPTMKRKCPWVFSMERKEVSLASALVSSNMCYNLTNPKAMMDSRGENGKGWFIWSWYICGISRIKLGLLISMVAVTSFRWIAMERPISLRGGEILCIPSWWITHTHTHTHTHTQHGFSVALWWDTLLQAETSSHEPCHLFTVPLGRTGKHCRL